VKLYHGTNETTAFKALAQGLRARGREKGNWAHSLDSNPTCVYLTQLYAGYFAANACAEGEKWGLIEVDTDKLDQRLLRPDEDALEQSFRGRSPDDYEVGTPGHHIVVALAGMDMEARTRWFRERLGRFADQWLGSLKAMGTCCYEGQIPTRAISRVVLYDPESNPAMTIMCLDPSISVLNCQYMRPKYEALTAWLMGGALPLDPWRAMLSGPEELEQMERVAQVRGLRVLKGNNMKIGGER
jgi:hypothetical protein